MGKRADAKEAIKAYLVDNHIRYPLKAYDKEFRVKLTVELNALLARDFGYTTQGTRSCIINEVFRDTGKAPKRDTYRRRVYIFEDKVLLRSMIGTDITEELDILTLKRILLEMCECLEINAPKLVFDEAHRYSYAQGSRLISLAPKQRNRFVLTHELSHIYGNITQEAYGHDARFVATEMALLDLYLYNELEAMFRLAGEHNLPVDKDYGRAIKRKLTSST